MIYYYSALEVINSLAGNKRDHKSETLFLEFALRRILADNIFSHEDVPGFDNSAMDGFALSAQDTTFASQQCPVSIKITGVIAAGDSLGNDLTEDDKVGLKGVEIMTGSVVPKGYDCVIKIEDGVLVKDLNSNIVEIKVTAPVKRGQNIRKSGTDFKVGDLICKKGTLLMPEHILALASLGVSRVKVLTRPKIALISTGKELVSISQEDSHHLPLGKIRNSTAPFLKAASSLMGVGAGVDLQYFGTIPDDPTEFQKLIGHILKDSDFQPDLVVTTGAVSMGKHDFIKESLIELGAKIHFHKVAIRPGKPLLLAEFEGGPVFFGLPGNPISSAVGFRFFIEPYLRTFLNLKAEAALRCRLFEATRKPVGLRCFFKARLCIDENGAQVQVLSGQESYKVQSLVQANCWAVLEEEGEIVENDKRVEVFPLYPGYEFAAELNPVSAVVWK